MSVGTGRPPARHAARTAPRHAGRAARPPKVPLAQRATPALVLLPLRLFLGATFGIAGAGKLLGPGWFGDGSTSLAAAVRASAPASPLHGLLEALVLPHAGLFAWLIASSELLVGALTLVGLASRAAAAGGLALSVAFFLTVGWRVRPFYAGPDLPFAAAWIPLLLAGHAGLPSLDRRLHRRARSAAGLPGDGGALAVPLDRLRDLERCPAAGDGHCDLAAGPACPAPSCPLGGMATNPTAAGASRRALLSRLAGAGIAAAAAGALGAIAALDAGGEPTGAPAASGRPGQPRPAPTTVTGSRSGEPVARLTVGAAASFRDPGSGAAAVVVRLSRTRVVAFRSACTHAGCRVQYDSARATLVCPCHGAQYDPAEGAAVLAGPAPSPLPAVEVRLGPGGAVYLGK